MPGVLYPLALALVAEIRPVVEEMGGDVVLGSALAVLDMTRAPVVVGVVPSGWTAGEELTQGPRDCQVEELTFILEIWTSTEKDPEDAFRRSEEIACDLRDCLGADREGGPLEVSEDCGPLKVSTIWQYDDQVNSGILARQVWTCARIEE